MRHSWIRSLSLAICMSLLLAGTALAARYANALALFESWERDGYPADVAGVYSTDGSAEHLTIQLIGDTDGSREAELRAMLEDDSTVTFEPGTYSEQKLREIAAEISNEYLDSDAEVYSVGVGWGTDGGYGENGTESRVVVQASPARCEALRAALEAQYGDAVRVEESEGPVDTTGEVPDQLLPEEPDSVENAVEQAEAAGETLPEKKATPVQSAERSSAGVWIAAAVLAAGAAALAVLAVRRRRRK